MEDSKLGENANTQNTQPVQTDVKQEKMTLHKALAELKLIDKKLSKKIVEFNPVGLHIKGRLVNDIHKQEDFERDVKADAESINDLFERKIKIKAAIVKVNGETTVTIGGKVMTIADAINRKSIIGVKKELLKVVVTRYNAVIGKMNVSNERLNERLDKYLIELFGKEKVEAKDANVEGAIKTFREMNEFLLCDPIKANDTAIAIDKEIMDFESEVDYVLSETNSTTFIYI